MSISALTYALSIITVSGIFTIIRTLSQWNKNSSKKLLVSLKTQQYQLELKDLSERDIEAIKKILEESSSLPESDYKSNSILFRYPNLECPESSLINKRFSLYVQILIKSPDPAIKAMAIQDTGVTEKLPKVEIVVRARSFDIEGSNTRIIQIDRNDDTEERFVLIPRKLGQQEIRVDFYQNNERISTTRKNILINHNKSSTTVEIAQPENPTALELKKEFLVPAPDLELCIQLDKSDGRTLYFTLHSSKSDINYHHKDVGQVKLQVTPKARMKSVDGELGHLAE